MRKIARNDSCNIIKGPLRGFRQDLHKIPSQKKIIQQECFYLSSLKGHDGTNGPNGPNGLNGLNGPDGPNGPNPAEDHGRV